MKSKKHLKITMIMLLVLALSLGLAGCGGDSGGSGDPIKGTWTGESDDGIVSTWVFDGKGGCKFENEYGAKDEGEYSVEGDKLMILMDDWDADEPSVYEFEVSGSDLSFENIDDTYRPSYQLTKK